MSALPPSLAWLASMALVFAPGCRASTPSPPARLAEDGWSRVVVHTAVQPPAGLRITPGVALVGGRPNPGGELPIAPFERVDAFPAELSCRSQSVCTLVIRKRLMAVVFAFDPVVEVDIDMPSGPERPAEVRYRDPRSTSAAMAMINERSAALESACRNSDIERAARRERAAPLERELRQLASESGRAEIGRAASLALVQGQCTDAPENRAIAKRLLDTLEPTAPELGPWTTSVRNLGALTGESARAEALVDAVIEQHPDPAVGGWLLLLRMNDLGDAGDPHVREAIARRLAAPRFAKTVAAEFAKSPFGSGASIALVPGDRWPAIALVSVTGETIHIDDQTTGPRLVYFSASWCKSCIDSLPRVRDLAAEHPELRIVYVLWDGPDDAREFVAKQAAIPGEVAWTDQRTRKLLSSQVMKYVSLPSFVLLDTGGIVVATSDDIELSELEVRLDALGETRAP